MKKPVFIPLAAAFALALCSVTASQGGAQEILTLAVTGPAVTVSHHATDACEPLDYTDAPARAIRTASGQVQLYATHFINRRLTGPDLLHLREDCRVVYKGAENDDPAAFDDRQWITSLSTDDGVTVTAIVHDEFQGHRRPWLCPTGRYLDCWYNSLVQATSTDGGQTFRRAPGAQALVAALPLRYDETRGRHAGYFNPTGMVDMGGYRYMMAFATDAGSQREGNCLMRTGRVADPHAWRAWDGSSYSASFVNPYAGAIPEGLHTCTPVGRGGLKWPVTSLVRHTPDGTFLALMMNGAAAADGGGVWYSTSTDLLKWTAPVRIIEGEGEGHWKCGETPPVSYPSLLDPGSPARDFSTVGNTAVIFMTRYSGPGCKLVNDRDLIRIPVTLRP